jgi:hypothetical protein
MTSLIANMSASKRGSSRQETNRENSRNSETLSVRLKPYSGLEIKTLWNHFQKDDLMTVNQVGALLDRILIKDASDVYTSLKLEKSWSEFCNTALRLLDKSGGGTVDLGEFDSQFNSLYLARFYYIAKFLIPALMKQVKSICDSSNLDAEMMKELLPILTKDGKVKIEEKIVMKDSDKTAELAEIKRLKDLVNSLTDEVNLMKADFNRVSSGSESVNQMLREKDIYIDKLRTESASETDSLKSRIANLESELEKVQSENQLMAKQIEMKSKQQISELRELSEKQSSANRDKDLSIASLSKRLEGLDAENGRLRETSLRDLNEWKTKFENIIDENSEIRSVLSSVRAEANQLNGQLLDQQMKSNRGRSDSLDLSTLHAAALSGISLDPFRVELVKKFGSLESVFGKKREKMTLNEMELVASSMGYSREYSRKLFFALDIKNRGFLTLDQFARPLPLLNKELCLLTKGPIQ